MTRSDDQRPLWDYFSWSDLTGPEACVIVIFALIVVGTHWA